jgi:hypothetical protein
MSSKSLATHATHAKNDLVADYRNLPEPLKKQLAKLQEKFEDESEIKSLANELYRKAYRQYGKTSYRSTTLNLKKIALRMAMLRAIPSDTLLHSRWFPHVTAYDHRGHLVRLEKEIAQGRHVYVIAGKLDNEIPVVVKWYQSNRRDTLYEISIYKRLRKMGCDTPWFSSSYRFWDFPVLVMEKLHSLTKEDDEFEMAIQVLQQLTYLHQFGIHNDIKPGNVMKRLVDGKPKYLMIDHGGVATQKYQYGYRRFIWSPKFTSQKPHESNQITTAKHDFLELGICMKAIQNMRTGESKVRSGFTGKLKKFMDRVELINQKDVKSSDYEDLIKILQE